MTARLCNLLYQFGARDRYGFLLYTPWQQVNKFATVCSFTMQGCMWGNFLNSFLEGRRSTFLFTTQFAEQFIHLLACMLIPFYSIEGRTNIIQ